MATSALFVLTTTGANPDALTLLERLVDTGIGVVVGVLINLVVLPPLSNRSAQQRVDTINRKLGGLLTTMAEQLGTAEQEGARSWIEHPRYRH